MTNSVLLKEIVKESGLKKTFIAERMGVSYSTYMRKESGKSPFYSDELSIMWSLLNLSEKEVTDIFFSKSN